ncbi:MAG: class I SAM-dependent methyltransferase [Planctomycetota bacterium]
MNLPRTPEPTIMSAAEEAAEYLGMDHSGVNALFVDELLVGPVGPRVIDLGCGPGLIPIELCGRDPSIELMAVDGAVEMLELAKVEVDMAGLLDRITLHHVDANGMDDFEDGIADTVISNSLIHHLDEPALGLATAARLVKPGGRLFIRDLYRPDSEETVEKLVQQYAGQEQDMAKQLFRQSLHASLTLAEVRELAGGLGIGSEQIQMSSDRHWTIDWTKPVEV